MPGLFLLLAALAAAPAPPAPPTYPEGAAVPRGLTDEERAWLAVHPLAQPPQAVAAAPAGPIRCPAEYEPMAGILIAWEGPAAWRTILGQIGAKVTTVGKADLYPVVDDAAEQTAALAALQTAGADPARVHPVIAPTDSIWMRDYGPRFICEGGCRAIVDHEYNRPRPNDDAFPAAFATLRNQARYDLPLVHGGGNFHLDALDRSYTTRLVVNENPGLTEAGIRGLWQDFQAVDSTFFDPFPTAIDTTQHLDMWMQVIADDAVMISDWPQDSGSTQDRICDAAAATMAGKGYTVHRLPARSVAGTHYTYTNVVMVNDLVLIPSYSNAQVSAHNAEALAVWRAALPGKTVVAIDAQAIVTSSGVLHCIVMHVPAPLSGARPSVYLESDRGCVRLAPGAEEEVRWISDDDRGTRDVDILLSIDGGRSFPYPIVTGAPDTGSFRFVVPGLPTASARLRIVVHDDDGNAGSDESDEDLAIGADAPRPAPPQPLLAVKRPSGGVLLSVPVVTAAAAYNVYEGAIGAFYTSATPRCWRDTADPALVITAQGTVEYRFYPAAGSRWLLESASDCFAESSLGLPPAAWMCGPTR